MKNVYQFPLNPELNSEAGQQMDALLFALRKLGLSSQHEARRLTITELRNVTGLRAVYNDLLGRGWTVERIDRAVDASLGAVEAAAVDDAIRLAVNPLPVSTTLPKPATKPAPAAPRGTAAHTQRPNPKYF